MRLNSHLLLCALSAVAFALIAASSQAMDITVTDCAGLPRLARVLEEQAQTDVQVQLGAETQSRLTLSNIATGISLESTASNSTATFYGVTSGTWKVCGPEVLKIESVSFSSPEGTEISNSRVAALGIGALTVAGVTLGATSGGGSDSGSGTTAIAPIVPPVQNAPSTRDSSIGQRSTTPLVPDEKPSCSNKNRPLAASDCGLDERPTPLSPIA